MSFSNGMKGDGDIFGHLTGVTADVDKAASLEVLPDIGGMG